MKVFYFLLLSFIICSCEKSPPSTPPPAKVSIVVVKPQTIPANFEYIGVGESSHIVELRARVEGYLEQITYDEGSLVNEGALLFVIDQRPFLDEVESTKGVLERQKALLWNAVQVKNRMVPLYKENAVSQRDMDNAIADELAAKANVQTAWANLQKAELNLSFCSITAPVTAMASRAIFREGALISPGPNSLLTNLFVIDPIWVNFSVSSGDLLKAREEIKQGRLIYPKDNNFSIEVTMADGSILPATGKIDFTDPALQQSTGTMLVRSVMANPEGFLRPGQFVKVAVKGAVRPNATIVPQSAILQGQGGTFVFVVNNENKAEVRPVVLGDWYKDFWIVLSGLKNGDHVVVEGVNRIGNGSPVTISSIRPDTPEETSTTTHQLPSPPTSPKNPTTKERRI